MSLWLAEDHGDALLSRQQSRLAVQVLPQGRLQFCAASSGPRARGTGHEGPTGRPPQNTCPPAGGRRSPRMLCHRDSHLYLDPRDPCSPPMAPPERQRPMSSPRHQGRPGVTSCGPHLTPCLNPTRRPSWVPPTPPLLPPTALPPQLHPCPPAAHGASVTLGPRRLFLAAPRTERRAWSPARSEPLPC